jgi:hypothetical protein
LDVKRSDGRPGFSTGRFQLLIASAVFSLWFLHEVYVTGRLPDVPEQWLAVLVGSHSTYLIGKARTTFQGH